MNPIINCSEASLFINNRKSHTLEAWINASHDSKKLSDFIKDVEAEIQAKLNKISYKPAAVKVKATRASRRWTAQEELELKRDYPTIKTSLLAARYNSTVTQISSKAGKLKLRKAL